MAFKNLARPTGQGGFTTNELSASPLGSLATDGSIGSIDRDAFNSRAREAGCLG